MMNFTRLITLIDVLHKGKQLANSETWKNGAAATSLMGGVLVALATIAKSYGHDIGLGEKDWFSVAGAAFLVGQAYVHIATSKNVGLPAAGDAGTE